MNFADNWNCQLKRALKVVHGLEIIFLHVTYVINLLKNQRNEEGIPYGKGCFLAKDL
jgi:hypothetical protein